MADDTKLNSANFDETKFYESEVIPVIKTLVEKCRSHNLPITLCVNFMNDESKCGICNIQDFANRRNEATIRMVIGGKLVSGKLSQGDAAAIALAAMKMASETGSPKEKEE
ncbi:MAG: hypothetical protein AB7F40_04435 [Victivallaceae bacterium]